MKTHFKLIIATGLIALAGLVCAQPTIEQQQINPDQANTVRTAINKARPGLTVSDIRTTPIANLLEIDLGGNDTAYITIDGKYLFTGNMFRIEEGRFVNVADERMQPLRAAKIASVKKEDMVVFPAVGETQAHITVFTDIDCGYCRKLHKEVPELNAMGIEVRYLAFPRAGSPSPSADKLETVWCAKDREQAMTDMKNGKELATNKCGTKIIAAQYELGLELGINGTPAIIKPNGELLPGYMPAAKLAQSLNLKPKAQ